MASQKCNYQNFCFSYLMLYTYSKQHLLKQLEMFFIARSFIFIERKLPKLDYINELHSKRFLIAFG